VTSGIRSASLAVLAVLAGAAGIHFANEASRREVVASEVAAANGALPEIDVPPSAVAPVPADLHHQLAASLDRALAARDPAQRETAFTQLLPALLSDAPAIVREWFDRQPPGESRDAFRDELARQWIVQDRQAASTWVDSLSGEDRVAATTIAMRALSARSPGQALDFARRFAWGRDDGSLEHLVQIWATDDPEAAANWIDAQPRDDWNDRLRARIDEVRHARVSGV
jgi:hypothetical protein